MWKKLSFSWIEICLILIISPLLCISKKCESHFRRESANKHLKVLKKQKLGNVTHIWLANVFKGTVVNCNLCMEGHLKFLLITFIKVLRGGKKVCWIWVWTRKNVILKRFQIRRFPWRELIFLNLLGTVVFNGYRGR